MGRTKWRAAQQRAMLDENATLFNSMGSNGQDYFIGLDFSLTSTGVAVLDKEGEPVELVSVQSSAKDGTTIERVAKMADTIKEIVEKYPPQIVAVESIVVSTNIKSTMDLCRVSGAVLRVIYDAAREGGYDMPYVLYCNVSSLKKAASKSGVATKGTMQMEVLDKWGIRTGTDDEADAVTAAKLATKLSDFFRSYIFATATKAGEDFKSLLMDVCKERSDRLYEKCAEMDITEEEANVLVGIMTGSSKGGSGLKQMKENDKSFYYEARKRLKEF